MATILYVDDSSMVRQLLRVVLANAGHTVVGASCGAECLAKVSQERPDMVLLDMVMPEMDGLETLRRLRANPACADLPVLLLSGDTTPGTIATATALGARGCIVKPFDQQALRQRIQAELGAT